MSLPLGQLRDIEESYMEDRVTHLRPARPTHGGSAVLGTVGTALPARMLFGAGQFRDVAARFPAAMISYTLKMPWDHELRVDDVILDEADREFHVRHVDDARSYRTRTTALVELVA